MDLLISLVVLRFKLDVRAMARARDRAVGLLLAIPGLAIFSGVGSVLVFVSLRTLERAQPEAVLPLASAVTTLVGLLFVFSPLLTGVAATETHDLLRLLHFPIPLATLVASSLIANLIQPFVLAEVPIVLSLALAAGGGLVRFPLALAGAVLSFVFALVAAQVVGLLVLGLTRDRRFRDLALFLGLGLGFLISILPALVLWSQGRVLGSASRLVLTTDVFALSPFAWGVRAAVHAGRGEAGPFVLHVAAAMLAIAAAMGVSTALIHRVYRGELDVGEVRGRSVSRARMVLSGALGALIEKDVRSLWRDPALKATLVMSLAGPFFFLFVLSQMRRGQASDTTLLVLAGLIGLAGFGANAFGYERRGVALLVGFPVERWRILLSKNLTAVVFRLPAFLTLLVLGLFVGPFAYLPAALTIAMTTFLILAGADNYLSILFPITAPAPGQNPYGPTSGGRGLGVAALSAVFMAGSLVLAAPFVFLAWLPLLLGNLGLWLLSLPLAWAGAVAVYAMLLAGAARLLSRREPELVARIMGEA